jgi:hypothetical protein
MGSEWQVPGADDAGAETTWDQPEGDGLTALPDPPSSGEAWDADATSPVADGAEAAFEPPALHPDIAKALAESTYADSATAINAMAARLGASDAADDDDDWDDGVDSGGETDAFWSSDGDTSGGAAAEFTWQPAAWDTGVEATPLPQREHVPRDPDDPSGPASSADPEWLENLYSQFMPGEGQGGGKGPNSVETALGAAPADAAPKARTLRRLMSAIKRL